MTTSSPIWNWATRFGRVSFLQISVAQSHVFKGRILAGVYQLRILLNREIEFLPRKEASREECAGLPANQFSPTRRSGTG